MSDWQEVCVGDLFELEPGYAFKSSEFRSNGLPVIKIKNVKAGYFSEHDFDFVDPSFLHLRPKKVAKNGDLLISMSGNRHDGSPETWVGKVAPFRANGQYMINQRVGALRARSDASFDVRFVGYLLASWPFQQHFISVATSSGGQANLSPSQILSVRFRLPDLRSQIRIGKLLGSLDDKIELNRRMNETLEAMAQAIFRDWFVDFGPTRRKMKGATDPVVIMGGLVADAERAQSLADLFPASLGDDGLPVGWQSQSFSSFIEIIGGGTPKTSIEQYWSGPIPWFSVTDTPPKGSVFVDATEKNISREGLDSSSARLVRAGTTIISARGTVGNLAMAAQEMTFNQSCYGLQGRGQAGDCFVFLATQTIVERLKNMAHGSVFSTITRATFEGVDLVRSSEAIFSAFEELVEPMFNKILANVKQNRTLAATRDLLLPKLMSGEIRLGEAEEMVEAGQ